MIRRWDRFMANAARHPRAFVLGVREFRRAFTTHFDDCDALEAYDTGREVAHIVTLRRYDD